MAITLHTAGSWVAANATTQTVTLPTHSTGDMLIVRCGMKHATMPSTVTCDTAGWTKLGQDNSGTTASGNGSGSTLVAVFYKEATSGAETNPVITYHASVAATPSAAVAMAYQKGAGEAWVTPEGVGGNISVATNFSATMQSHIAAKSGDLIDAFVVTNDNTTLTVPTFTQTGLTLDAVTESPATALSSATSNDISADGCFRTATAGTSSAALVYTGTNSAADEGIAWTTRLRVNINTTVTPSTASLTTTTFAPTVTATANQLVTPGAASLTLTGFAPTVLTPRSVTPGTAVLTLTTFAPTVTATTGTVVTPGTAALTLTTFAPTVTATDNKMVTPTTAALALTGFAPTVTATANQLVTPGTASLTLTSFAPTVTATGVQTATGGALSLQGRRRRTIPEPIRDEEKEELLLLL